MLPAMIKLDEIYQSREFKSLDDIFDNDSTGLLDNVKPTTKKASANNILEQQFLNINTFVDTHGHPPRSEVSDITEKILARQLAAIQENAGIVKDLMSLDEHGLLSISSELESRPEMLELEATKKDEELTCINKATLEPPTTALDQTTQSSEPDPQKNVDESPLSISSLNNLL